MRKILKVKKIETWFATEHSQILYLSFLCSLITMTSHVGYIFFAKKFENFLLWISLEEKNPTKLIFVVTALSNVICAKNNTRCMYKKSECGKFHCCAYFKCCTVWVSNSEAHKFRRLPALSLSLLQGLCSPTQIKRPTRYSWWYLILSWENISLL